MLSAQTASPALHSTRDGVYTAEQAQLGKAIYQSRCAMCHGDALEGVGANSPLAGNAFFDKWADQTVADLFMKTITTMPATGPGSLTPEETARLLSYLLSVNKLKAGKQNLSTNPQILESIRLDKP